MLKSDRLAGNIGPCDDLGRGRKRKSAPSTRIIRQEIAATMAARTAEFTVVAMPTASPPDSTICKTALMPPCGAAGTNDENPDATAALDQIR